MHQPDWSVVRHMGWHGCHAQADRLSTWSDKECHVALMQGHKQGRAALMLTCLNRLRENASVGESKG